LSEKYLAFAGCQIHVMKSSINRVERQNTHVIVPADDASVFDNTDKPFVDDGIFLSVFLFLTYRYHVYDLDQQW
jgi:hypothetical protein